MTFNLKDFRLFGLIKVKKICLVKEMNESAIKDMVFRRAWQPKAEPK